MYYDLYDTQVKELLEKDGVIILKKGDRVTITVENTNQTIGQILRNFIYRVLGDDASQIAAQYTAVVSVNGSTKSN